MYYLDKKNQEGAPLTIDAIKLNERISNYCFEKTKNTKIYAELKKYFQNDYLEMYFKRLYSIEGLNISHNITLNAWNKKNGQHNNFVIINTYSFSAREYLKEFLTSNKIKFEDSIDQNIIKENLNKYFKCLKKILKMILLKIKRKKIINDNSNAKIAVAYNEGVNLDKRSDLFWFNNSKVNPNDVIIYFEYFGQLNRHSKKKYLFSDIKKLGVQSINLWEHNIEEEFDFLKILRKNLKNIDHQNQNERFLKKISFELIDKYEYWYSFFKKFNIKIHIDAKDFGLDAIIKYIALNKAKGCTIGKLRSYIEEKRSSGVAPINACDIFFVPNLNSAHRLKNYTASKFQYMIVNGYPYNPFTKNNLLEIKKIKEYFKENNKKFILLLLDSEHSDNKNNNFQTILSDKLHDFYNTFFAELSKIDGLGIIIKNKKIGKIRELKDIYQKILNYKKDGFCYLVEEPFQKMPALYASISDLVVAVCHGYPSALIESVLKKKRGVFYDINNLKMVEKEWYKWGENKVIFNDPKKMLDQIINLKNNITSSQNFADWTIQTDLLDPYQDNLGSERIGNYINSLLKSFKSESSNREALLKANNEFANNWGKDKIIKGNLENV